MTTEEQKKKERRIKRARAGGLALFKKRGRDHMINIGRKGAIVFHDRYTLAPFRQNDFLIVRKKDNYLMPKTLSGNPIDPADLALF